VTTYDAEAYDDDVVFLLGPRLVVAGEEGVAGVGSGYGVGKRRGGEYADDTAASAAYRRQATVVGAMARA
jgi:hypothetical protein